MPGTSTRGAHRLLRATALAAGAVVVAAVPAPSLASTSSRADLDAGATRAVVSTGHSMTASSGTPGDDAPAGTSPQLAAVPGGGVAVAPAATPGVEGAASGAGGGASGAVSGQAAGAAELSVDSASAPPAAVPWIVGVLFVLVVAGAVRAYGRSPQRAAIRSRRTPP